MALSCLMPQKCLNRILDPVQPGEETQLDGIARCIDTLN